MEFARLLHSIYSINARLSINSSARGYCRIRPPPLSGQSKAGRPDSFGYGQIANGVAASCGALSGLRLAIKLDIESDPCVRFDLMFHGGLDNARIFWVEFEFFDLRLQYSVYEVSFKHDDLTPCTPLGAVASKQGVRYRPLSKLRRSLRSCQVGRQVFHAVISSCPSVSPTNASLQRRGARDAFLANDGWRLRFPSMRLS